MPDLVLEIAAGGVVAGVDEAGRGPLAGPVVAAAVVFDRSRLPERLRAECDDSKRLTAKRRAELHDVIQECARVGVGMAEVAEIDTWNILQASLRAMARAVAALGVAVDHALVDGNQKPSLPCNIQCVVGGDGTSLSIAAASIIAKVTRDRLMTRLAADFPGYGWETNVGYGTREHLRALSALGPTPHHRRSFAPVQALLTL